MATLNRAALETLERYRFRARNMSGPDNAAARQSLMLAITGQKLPKAKCGITAVDSEIRAILKPGRDCQAREEHEMESAMRNLLSIARA